jgi:MFS transporter, DHA1 family, staphyloferrin B biosynthesis exporter
VLFRRRTPSPITEAYKWDLRTALLAGLYTGSIQPFIGRIARGDLDCTPFQLSLMMAAPFVGNLFSPLWARQMEGKSKMPFAAGSWAVARGLLFFLAFTTSAWPFVLLVALSSLVMTVATPAYASIMKDIYPDALRGRLMGYIRVFLQGMAFFTALVVGRLLDLFHYQYIFPIGAVAGIAAAWTFSRVPIPRRPEAQENGGPPPSIRSTLSILKEDKNYRWFALSVFVYGFGNLLVQPLYTLFQVDVLHITNSQVANMANLQSITAIMGYFFWGRFLDRRGSLTTVLISTLLVSMINVVYMLAFNVETLYLAAIIAGISFSGIELSYLNATITFADRSRIAQYQSIHSALLGVRGTVAPLLGPVVMHAVGLRGAFAVSFGIILLGAAMQYFNVRVREGQDRVVAH